MNLNKKGSYIGLFVMIVVVFVVVLFFVVMTYVGVQTQTKLEQTFSQIDPNLFGNQNATAVIANTIGEVNEAYSHLVWISVMLIIGMVLSILYGSYKVRTRPIYFLPYFLITGVAIIVSAGIANAWEDVIAHQTLQSTFALFTGANHFMLYLPVYMTIIGLGGGIILFISWATRPEGDGGYAYYGY